MFKLVEESSGIGELIRENRTLGQVQYRIRRFQGVMEGSGLPIPGLFRIEGQIERKSAEIFADALQVRLVLRLGDGRSLGIVIVDPTGKILSEGHGPSRCLCC